MTAKQLIEKAGIKESDIVSILGNKNESIDNGYYSEIEDKSISFFHTDFGKKLFLTINLKNKFNGII